MEDLRDETERRIRNLTALTNAIEARLNARSEFGTSDELEEIGLITLRVAMLEEHIAHHCEILLIRPELRGFYSTKSVLVRGLGDKLDLYKSLVIAAGTLYSIDTIGIENNVVRIKELGEERHAVIHGYLFRNPTDNSLMFRNKAKEIPATLEALSIVSERCVTVTVALIETFVAFYSLLLEKPVTYTGLSAEENIEMKQVGVSLLDALAKLAKWHDLVARLRQVTGKTTDL
jgi:hypothetical protein